MEMDSKTLVLANQTSQTQAILKITSQTPVHISPINSVTHSKSLSTAKVEHSTKTQVASQPKFKVNKALTKSGSPTPKVSRKASMLMSSEDLVLQANLVKLRMFRKHNKESFTILIQVGNRSF